MKTVSTLTVPRLLHSSLTHNISSSFTGAEKKALDAKKKADAAAAVATYNGTKRGALGDARPTKRQTTHKEHADKRGDILFSGRDDQKMPLPTIPNRDEVPCAAHYREGHLCRKGDKCKYSHTRINNLSPESQKIWQQHVWTPTNPSSSTRSASTLHRRESPSPRGMATKSLPPRSKSFLVTLTTTRPHPANACL